MTMYIGDVTRFLSDGGITIDPDSCLFDLSVQIVNCIFCIDKGPNNHAYSYVDHWGYKDNGDIHVRLKYCLSQRRINRYHDTTCDYLKSLENIGVIYDTAIRYNETGFLGFKEMNIHFTVNVVVRAAFEI